MAPQAIQDGNEEAAKNNTQARPLTTTGFLHWVAGLRDGVLACGAVVYVLGFLCWATYASFHDLGTMPILYSQYIVAGVIPSIILLLTALTGRGLLNLSRWTNQAPTPLQKKVGYAMEAGGFILLFVLMLAHAVSAMDWLRHGTFGAFALMVIGSFCSRAAGDRFTRFLGIGLAWTYNCIIPLMLILLYVLVWLPAIPHQWGGLRPRPVELDFEPTALSANTRRQLMDNTVPSNSDPVQRSKQIYLVLEGPRFLVFSTGLTPTSSVFRIDSSAVRAVVESKTH